MNTKNSSSTAVKVPPPTVYLLDNDDELVPLLCEATGEPRNILIQRLIDQEAFLGTNVRRVLRNVNVRTHVWSDHLVEFYRTTRSFLYEKSVWNLAPLKLEMRDRIGRFLDERAPGRSLKVLCFGDGLGFDCVYLAAAGHQVTDYELADECVQFAKHVFAANQQTVNIAQLAESLPAGEFDVVISLDVREHVPSPPECVGMFAHWLKPGGWLLAPSPFFFTNWHRGARLKSSRKYSGCKEHYRQQGLHPVDVWFFRDRIALVALKKASLPPKNSNPGTVNLGGLLLKLGRYSNAIHCAIAQTKAGTDRRWKDDLVQRFQVTASV